MPIITATELYVPATYIIYDENDDTIEYYTCCLDDAMLICRENKNFSYKPCKLTHTETCVSWVNELPEESDNCCKIL